jgi:hypothetical protein
VELAGWGAKVRNGAVSSSLKRITVRVFSMRYSLKCIIFQDNIKNSFAAISNVKNICFILFYKRCIVPSSMYV